MYQRILVGTDGSPTAAKAVDRAVELARSTGAELTVFSAGRADEAERIVAGEAERLAASGVPVATRTAEGSAVDALIDAAHDGFDVLVVGNRGMQGITRLLRPGSVPNKLSHRLPCTMLVVKTS